SSGTRHLHTAVQRMRRPVPLLPQQPFSGQRILGQQTTSTWCPDNLRLVRFPQRSHSITKLLLRNRLRFLVRVRPAQPSARYQPDGQMTLSAGREDRALQEAQQSSQKKYDRTKSHVDSL